MGRKEEISNLKERPFIFKNIYSTIAQCETTPGIYRF